VPVPATNASTYTRRGVGRGVQQRARGIVIGSADLVDGRDAHVRVCAEVSARRRWLLPGEHCDALDEFPAAMEWYENARPAWGDVFMDAVDAAINSILGPAIRWGFYRDRRSEPQVCSRSVAGFPFRSSCRRHIYPTVMLRARIGAWRAQADPSERSCRV
jgi:hypothetical protein